MIMDETIITIQYPKGMDIMKIQEELIKAVDSYVEILPFKTNIKVESKDGSYVRGN